jgi:hypothetical protein
MRSNQLINSFSTPHEKKYSSRYFYFAYILIPLIILPLLLSVFANQISNLGLPYKDVLAPYITLALMSKPVIFMVWLCVLPLFEIAILIINKQNKNYKIFTLKVLGDDKFLENTIKTRVSCSLIYFINALLILVLFDFLELIYPMCEPNSLGISWKYNSVQLMLCTILTICTELIYLNSNILSGRSVNRTRYNTKKIRPIYFSVKQDKQTIKNLVILLFSIFIFSKIIPIEITFIVTPITLLIHFSTTLVLGRKLIDIDFCNVAHHNISIVIPEYINEFKREHHFKKYNRIEHNTLIFMLFVIPVLFLERLNLPIPLAIILTDVSEHFTFYFKILLLAMLTLHFYLFMSEIKTQLKVKYKSTPSTPNKKSYWIPFYNIIICKNKIVCWSRTLTILYLTSILIIFFKLMWAEGPGFDALFNAATSLCLLLLSIMYITWIENPIDESNFRNAQKLTESILCTFIGVIIFFQTTKNKHFSYFIDFTNSILLHSYSIQLYDISIVFVSIILSIVLWSVFAIKWIKIKRNPLSSIYDILFNELRTLITWLGSKISSFLTYFYETYLTWFKK